jgi:hypothetical protein
LVNWNGPCSGRLPRTDCLNALGDCHVPRCKRLVRSDSHLLAGGLVMFFAAIPKIIGFAVILVLDGCFRA